MVDGARSVAVVAVVCRGEGRAGLICSGRCGTDYLRNYRQEEGERADRCMCKPSRKGTNEGTQDTDQALGSRNGGPRWFGGARG